MMIVWNKPVKHNKKLPWCSLYKKNSLQLLNFQCPCEISITGTHLRLYFFFNHIFTSLEPNSYTQQLLDCTSWILDRVIWYSIKVTMKIEIRLLTLEAVRSMSVDRSRMVRAALICARRRSSLRSFCLSPVTRAKSTISLPNWLNAFTNSVKLLTPSSRVSVFDTYTVQLEEFFK